VVPDLCSRNGIELMSSRKTQYEDTFDEWGFRKNRKKDDWQIMARKLDKRKRGGKESNVYLEGQLIPTKKLRKEISRQGYMSVIDQLNWAQGRYIQAPELM
jgi:hypothetical protein